MIFCSTFRKSHKYLPKASQLVWAGCKILHTVLKISELYIKILLTYVKKITLWWSTSSCRQETSTVLFRINRTFDLSGFRHFSSQMFDLSGKKTTHFFFKQLHFLMENQEIHCYFLKISPAALSGVRLIRGKCHHFFLRFDGGVRFIPSVEFHAKTPPLLSTPLQ